MTPEEKRAIHIEISQMLADAGINQATLRELVLGAINQKVEKAIEQAIKSLDSTSRCNNYLLEMVNRATTDARVEFEVKNTASKVLKEMALEALKDYSFVLVKRGEGSNE